MAIILILSPWFGHFLPKITGFCRFSYFTHTFFDLYLAWLEKASTNTSYTKLTWSALKQRRFYRPSKSLFCRLIFKIIGFRYKDDLKVIQIMFIVFRNSKNMVLNVEKIENLKKPIFEKFWKIIGFSVNFWSRLLQNNLIG